MGVCRVFLPVAALAALSLWVGTNGAHGQIKMKPFGGGMAGSTATMVMRGSIDAVRPGWFFGRPAYEYEGVKFSAPAPAVSLDGIESEQWRSDFRNLKFSKLKARKLLYAYYLSSLDVAAAREIFKAVTAEAAALKAKKQSLWAALGVEYDIKGMKLYDAKGAPALGEPAWLGRAAIPVMWSGKVFDLIKDNYDPETFAAVVSGAALSLPSGSYVNYWSLTGWSGAAEASRLKIRELKSEKIPKGMAVAMKAYADAVSKGPLKWPDLAPVASFIAVDRDLDIKGLKAKAIVTSKLAWPGVRK